MKKTKPLDHNELMIVNPGTPGNEEVLGSEQFFLGEDRTLYQVPGFQDESLFQGLAEFFLGEDGTLYRLDRFRPFKVSASFGETDVEEAAVGRYFLGEDGTLFEVIRL